MTAAVESETGLVWLRPHPLTMLVELVDAVKQTAVALFFILMQRGFSADSITDLVVIAFPLGLAGARWWSTRYAVTAEAVHHRAGILRKSSVVMPRSSIQSVTTQETLMARLTRTVELEVADAAAQSDIRLRLLSREDANRLMVDLRSTAAGASAEARPAGSAPLPGTQTAAPSAVEPARVADNRLIVRSSIGNGLSIGPLVFTVLVSVAIVVLVLTIGLGNIRQNVELIGATVVPLFLLSVPARIVTPLVRLMNFTLWATPDHLRSEGGLFTRQQGSSQRKRIQAVSVERHWVGRLLGVERVRYSTADFDGMTNSPSAFLDPGAPFGTWPDVVELAFGPLEVTDQNLIRVSPLARRRVLARFVAAAVAVLLVAVISGVVLASALGWFLVALAAALIMIGDVFSRRRWERLGWALGDEQFLVRSGAVDERISILLIEKIQSVTVRQSVGQRHLDLATVRVGTAGPRIGDVALPDLAVSDARLLADHLLQVAAAVPQANTI